MNVAVNISRAAFLAFLVVCLGSAITSRIVVDAHAITITELEPNDTNSTTNPLGQGQSGQGKIASGAEFDGWVLQNVRSSDSLFALLSSTVNDGDPILSGYYTNPIALGPNSGSDMYNDDGGPPAAGFRDSLFAGEPIRRTGSLYLRVDGFGSSTINPYELFQVVVSPNEVVPEIEPNNSIATAMPITAPAILANGSSEADFYSFYANAGERIVVIVDPDPGRPTPSSPFTAQITVFAPDGLTDISTPGNTFSCPVTNPCSAVGAIPAPATGTYYVKINKNPDQPPPPPPADPYPPYLDGDYRIAVLVEGATPLVGGCCNGTSCTQASLANCRGLFAGVGTSCIGDTDGDGVPNDCDNCALVGNLSQEDDDGDDNGNSCESCLSDPNKIAPGVCGCNIADTDSDKDGTANCLDACPFNSGKVSPGACGCAVPDADANHNKAIDCLPNPEIRALISSVVSGLKKLTDLSSGASDKARKARATKVGLLRAALTQIDGLIRSSASQINIVQAGFNISVEGSKFTKIAGQTLRSKGDNLTKNKKKLVAQGSKLLKAIAR